MYSLIYIISTLHLNSSESGLGSFRIKFIRPNSCDNSCLVIITYKPYFFCVLD